MKYNEKINWNEKNEKKQKKNEKYWTNAMEKWNKRYTIKVKKARKIFIKIMKSKKLLRKNLNIV